MENEQYDPNEDYQDLISISDDSDDRCSNEDYLPSGDLLLDEQNVSGTTNVYGLPQF
jgi:hypothetical protein